MGSSHVGYTPSQIMAENSAKESHQKNPTFEASMERLEAIVEEMESEKLPLEDLLVRYEEGVKLVRFCSEKLKAAEARIEIITRDAAGKPQLSEFEPQKKAPAASSGETRLF
jgi:exodeoxyribonuclease VII small subunit